MNLTSPKLHRLIGKGRSAAGLARERSPLARPDARSPPVAPTPASSSSTRTTRTSRRRRRRGRVHAPGSTPPSTAHRARAAGTRAWRPHAPRRRNVVAARAHQVRHGVVVPPPPDDLVRLSRARRPPVNVHGPHVGPHSPSRRGRCQTSFENAAAPLQEGCDTGTRRSPRRSDVSGPPRALFLRRSVAECCDFWNVRRVDRPADSAGARNTLRSQP